MIKKIIVPPIPATDRLIWIPSKSGIPSFSDFYDMLRNSPKIVSCYWVPPLAPWIKVNTDGSSKGNPGLGSCSGVYRDSSARFIGIFGAPLGICYSFFAEMKDALLAINFAFRYGWRWLWLETDSWAVYSCFSNSKYSPPWQLRNQWLQCKYWITRMDFVVTHTFREGNAVADTLTNAELHSANIICSKVASYWWINRRSTAHYNQRIDPESVKKIGEDDCFLSMERCSENFSPQARLILGLKKVTPQLVISQSSRSSDDLKLQDLDNVDSPVLKLNSLGIGADGLSFNRVRIGSDVQQRRLFQENNECVGEGCSAKKISNKVSEESKKGRCSTRCNGSDGDTPSSLSETEDPIKEAVDGKGPVCSNLKNQNSELNSKEVWNLEDEVAKVLKKGLALGLNFNWKKKELLDIIAKRDEAACYNFVWSGGGGVSDGEFADIAALFSLLLLYCFWSFWSGVDFVLVCLLCFYGL
ncbi:hypothetical protein Dsin_005842 [Dipteronia sinensis]|uniref:RNase H type-1 domain-containing protein n=1 Tax=Dipteronia sinensis TaxID=43782 RepID=A0AAE0AY37_9ROSI|nr:hypothetical protein Dsin_005842 [Dipteronia sinensis]